MRRTALWTSVLATSFGMALAAQSTTGTQTGTQPGQSGSTMKEDSSKTVTISGCVERGDRAGEFKLTNLDRSGTGSTSGTSATSGTSGTTGTGTSGTTGSATGTTGSGSMSGNWSDASAREYQLRARGASVRLDEHVGHKVEVTGTVAKEHSGSTAGTSGTGTMGTPGTSGTTGSSTSGTASTSHDAKGKTLEVTSLRMVSSTCSK